MSYLNKYVGKVVACRGIGSGVNVGVLLAVEGTTAVLQTSYFMRSWTYNNSTGSFHSLSTADLTGGDHIVSVKNDSVIMDLAHMVECDPALLKLCEKFKSA